MYSERITKWQHEPSPSSLTRLPEVDYLAVLLLEDILQVPNCRVGGGWGRVELLVDGGGRALEGLPVPGENVEAPLLLENIVQLPGIKARYLDP